MTDREHGELRVVVPVGFLLPEEREVSVSVDRPDGAPLPIRLRLIPARPTTPTVQPEPTLTRSWPTRHTARGDDGYPEPDYGGGD